VSADPSVRFAGSSGVQMDNFWRVEGMIMSSTAGSESFFQNVLKLRLTRHSGRFGQSVLHSGDGVPRGTAKWTKRNHTSAVKVHHPSFTVSQPS